MKKIIIVLLAIAGLSLMLSPVPSLADGKVTIDRMDGGTWIHFKVTADSAGTFTSTPFDATAALKLFLTTQNNYTARDTTIDNYFRLGNIFANVVTGTSSDSLSYLKLQGAGSNGVYRVFDTLTTAKNVPAISRIDFYRLTPLFVFWEITGAVYDTGTVDAVVYVDIFIPDLCGGKGGGESGESARRGLKNPGTNFGTERMLE